MKQAEPVRQTFGYPIMEIELEIEHFDHASPFEAIMDKARKLKIDHEIFSIRLLGWDQHGKAMMNVGIDGDLASRKMIADHWDMDPYDELVENYMQSLRHN